VSIAGGAGLAAVSGDAVLALVPEGGVLPGVFPGKQADSGTSAHDRSGRCAVLPVR
jgi:hypothetical protein